MPHLITTLSAVTLVAETEIESDGNSHKVPYKARSLALGTASPKETMPWLLVALFREEFIDGLGVLLVEDKCGEGVAD